MANIRSTALNDHVMFDDAQPLKPVFIPQFRAHNSPASARVLHLCAALHWCRFSSRKKTSWLAQHALAASRRG